MFTELNVKILNMNIVKSTCIKKGTDTGGLGGKMRKIVRMLSSFFNIGSQSIALNKDMIKKRTLVKLFS